MHGSQKVMLWLKTAFFGDQLVLKGLKNRFQFYSASGQQYEITDDVKMW